MTDWIFIIEFSLTGALLVMMVFGIAISAFMPTLDRWSKRYFISLFSLFFLCTVICFLAVLFWNDPSKAIAEKIIYIFEGLFLSTPIFMPTFFLLHHCGENPKKSSLFRCVTALTGIYVILLLISQFSNIFYSVTPENVFIRGPYYALTLLPLIIIMFFNITAVIKNKNKLSKKYYIALLIYLLPMTVAMLVHMFIAVEIFIVFGMGLFALIMFVLILMDNTEQYMRQQQEIANQRMSVMVLQMRPHFIYNTMMTIYYLCKQDADKAQQVTLEFTDYLRKNFNAIAGEDVVPFADELKHTQAYLAVEQAQHEDMLVVEYDTPVVNFRLPPLTLQPIVENAVKHGMDPDSDEPLCVWVKTRQIDDNIAITIEDTGLGFAVSENGETHSALANIKERLKTMCGGTLKIESRKNSGTIITVLIPKDMSK